MRPALAAAVDDEDVAALGAAFAEDRAQPHGVAHRAHRLVGDEDAQIGDVEGPPVGRRGQPRHIDDDVMELRAQHRKEGVDRPDGEFHLLVQRLLGAEHEEPLAIGRHQPFEQQVVDAQRVGERIAQAGARLDVEEQGAIAALHVEIDERDATGLAVGEMPGEIDRHCRGADAAAGTDDGDHLAELQADAAELAGIVLRWPAPWRSIRGSAA